MPPTHRSTPHSCWIPSSIPLPTTTRSLSTSGIQTARRGSGTPSPASRSVSSRGTLGPSAPARYRPAVATSWQDQGTTRSDRRGTALCDYGLRLTAEKDHRLRADPEVGAASRIASDCRWLKRTPFRRTTPCLSARPVHVASMVDSENGHRSSGNVDAIKHAIRPASCAVDPGEFVA